MRLSAKMVMAAASPSPLVSLGDAVGASEHYLHLAVGLRRYLVRAKLSLRPMTVGASTFLAEAIRS